MSERFLAGRHAVVTGGTRGIGAAIAEELARLGADLTVMGRDSPTLEERAGSIGAAHGTRVAAERCDVTDARDITRAFTAARKRFGDPYVLVNNAGQAHGARLMDTPVATWERLMAVNATAHFLCIREVLPAMVGARAGRIINIVSTAGLKGYSRVSAYCASKHASIGLTRALAMEVVKLGITVNAVCPGYTETDMAQLAVETLVAGRGVSEEEARTMVTGVLPRGSLITPAEVANAVAWLCSPGATAITGQSVVVASGEVM
ncbi:MAG TPA: SDR family oxidoreductase [Gemmatimonadaceae bacterium]|jgi:3-hydroxybutyrate dehydrogenase|nr:SDR family oxidoreductase [Gemmatimonadaceae bacterium]